MSRPATIARSISDPCLQSTSSELHKESAYVAGLRPFIGNPSDNSRLMAPHPMSPVRSKPTPDIDMKTLWHLRQRGNFVLQNSASHTFVPESSSADATEFSSHSFLTDVKRKHTRTALSPLDKYHRNRISSHSVGWHAETDGGRAMSRPPNHGLHESVRTKNYHIMQATQMHKCLRVCK